MPRFSSSRTSVAWVYRFGAFVRFGTTATSPTDSLEPSSRRGTSTSSRSGGHTASNPAKTTTTPDNASHQRPPRASTRSFRIRAGAIWLWSARRRIRSYRRAASPSIAGPRAGSNTVGRMASWASCASPAALNTLGGSATYSSPCARPIRARNPASASADSVTASVRM